LSSVDSERLRSGAKLGRCSATG